MIQRTYSLGNQPAGAGSSSHLGSNLATEGRLAKMNDGADRPEAVDVEPDAEGRGYKTP